MRKIVAVHRKAVEYIYAHHKEAAEVYAKVWNIKPNQAALILPKYYDWHHWNVGDFSKEGLAAVVEGLEFGRRT